MVIIGSFAFKLFIQTRNTLTHHMNSANERSESIINKCTTEGGIHSSMRLFQRELKFSN